MIGHVLVVDQGTTSTRSIVFGPDAASSAWRRRNSRRSFLSRAGSNMTQNRLW